MPTTIYIFGNLQVFQSALVGLQMIFNPANNTDWAVGGALFGVGPIVTIGLLFSLLHLATKGIWTQKMHLHHVGILLGLYSAMFVPQTSVTVQDIYSGQTVVVDGIPIGVAWPAAIVSQLAYDAATQLGQAFQQASATAPPTDLSQGFADPLKQMLELRKLYGNYVKMSPAMASNEFSFFQQCVYPMYTQDTSLMLAYNTSPDLFQTVTNTNYVTGATATSAGTPMQATILGGAGNALCPSGACAITCNALASGLATQYTNWFGGAGANSCSSAAALATSSSSSTQKPVTDCNATNMGGLLSQLGSNGNEYISQMIHTCMGAAGMSAGNQLLSGNPDSTVLPSYCVLQQNTLNQFQVDNANSASLFLKNMLSMMSILQFLFIALAPLAAFTMVMAGAQGLATFMKYIMFGLWTQSWLPVAALLNDYAQMTLSHQLAVIGQAVTGNAGNITAAVNAITLSGMPPAPANGLTITTIPAVLESVMQQLSIVNMMMAMTPIITMIVFTGSYMAMSSLADGITQEIDQHGGKNTGLETPSLQAQEAMNGVHASGNPLHPGMYSASAAMDGISIGNSQALTAGVNATVTSAAQHSQLAGAELALTRLSAAAAQLSHHDSVTGASSKTVTGHQGASASFGHSEQVGTQQSTAQTTQMIADAAYALNLKNLLSTPAGRAMTPEQREQAATQQTESMLKHPEALKAALKSGGLGALAGLAGGFSTKLDGNTSSKVAQQAARDVDDKLSNTSDAGVKTVLSGSLGLDSKDTKAVSNNKQVQDALKKAQSAQDTYQHTEQVATQVGASAGATVGQGLNGIQALSVLTDAGNGSAYAGGSALLAGMPDMQSDYAARFQKGMSQGLGPEQAAVTAYAATLRAHQASTEGLAALTRLYNQPGMIGLNAGLDKVLPLLDSVSNDVQRMQGNTAMPGGVPPGLDPDEAKQVIAGVNSTNAVPGQVARGTTGAAAIRPSTPQGTGGAGMTHATTFGTGGMGAVNQVGKSKTDPAAYDKTVDQNPATKLAHENATNSLLAKTSNWENAHPDTTLALMATANGLGGFINGLRQQMAERALVGKGGAPKGGDPGKPTAPDTPDGKPSAPDTPDGKPPAPETPEGKPGAAPTSAETPRSMTPGEIDQSKASLQARTNAGDPHPPASPITPPDGADAKRIAARDAARASLGEKFGALPDAAPTAVKFATEGVAKEAIEKSMMEAGARFVAKTAPAQAIAEVAASTGTPLGGLVATAVEGGVIVMNANMAADVIQTGAAIIDQYGPTKAAEIVASVGKDAVTSAARSAHAGGQAALANVSTALGLPPAPVE